MIRLRAVKFSEAIHDFTATYARDNFTIHMYSPEQLMQQKSAVKIFVGVNDGSIISVNNESICVVK